MQIALKKKPFFKYWLLFESWLSFSHRVIQLCMSNSNKYDSFFCIKIFGVKKMYFFHFTYIDVKNAVTDVTLLI